MDSIVFELTKATFKPLNGVLSWSHRCCRQVKVTSEHHPWVLVDCSMLVQCSDFWNMKSTIKQIFLPSTNSRSRSNSEAKRFLSEEFLFSKSDGVWRWSVWWKIFLSRYPKDCLQLTITNCLHSYRCFLEITCSDPPKWT